jgi:hypothetical protein
LALILARIGAKIESWVDIITDFGSIFRLAAGRESNLRKFADRIGLRWLFGVSTARAAFF